MELTPPHNGSHTGPTTRLGLHRHLDMAAAGLSLGCAVHCMALPLALAFLPGALIALRSFQHPLHGTMTLLLQLSRWEWAIALLAATACLASVGWGWRHHRRALPVALALVGSATLMLASLQFRDVVVLHGLCSAIGGAFMAAAHLRNRVSLARLRRGSVTP